jgi:hypothetical protein
VYALLELALVPTYFSNTYEYVNRSLKDEGKIQVKRLPLGNDGKEF